MAQERSESERSRLLSSDALYDPQARPLKVLVWNIQFAAGTACHFFYEGGSLVSVPKAATVFDTLDVLAEIIAAHDPDVVLLQEVDRNSRRSWYIDQHAELCKRLPLYVAAASTWYWQVPWVPTPLSLGGEMLGRVDVHLSVLSKYAISSVRRVALPAIRSDGCCTRLFNLRRAVQHITLATADGVPVHILHTHLSAFTKGDGTVEAQVATLRSLIADAGPRWMLAGDFNALPPGVKATGLTGQAALEYPAALDEVPSPIAPLFDIAISAIPLTVLTDPHRRAEHLTCKYFGCSTAEVTLDYLFLAPAAWAVEQARVARDARWPSDHAPIVARLRSTLQPRGC